jgi:hypothetical protein
MEFLLIAKKMHVKAKNLRIFQKISNRCVSSFHALNLKLECSQNLAKFIKYPQELLQIMNTITFNETNISQELLYSSKHALAFNVCERIDYHISLFLLPANCTLALHDHPSMMVLSKVVSGKLSMKSYTKVIDESVSSSSCYQPWELVERCVKSPADDAWFLSPVVGNIHEFTAVEPTVILDVLMPPYDANKGRVCTYYEYKTREKDEAIVGDISLLKPLPYSQMPNYSSPVYLGDDLYQGPRI